MKFKKGDKVVMHSSKQAEYYKGRVFTCLDDSFVDRSGIEMVFLEGHSTAFNSYFLALVDIPEPPDLDKLLSEAYQEGLNDGMNSRF